VIPTAERDALIALYNSTNGAGWSDRTNWRNGGDTDFNAPGTECTWEGVTCDAGETTVTEINLGSNGLDGTLPASLSDLTNLERLSLMFNSNLTGSIPPEFGSLANLTELWLSYDSLTGSIPAELGSLSNLQKLRLGQNDLTGTIPSELGGLSNLQDLYLWYNDLEGSIPPELGDLANLQKLYLSGNELTGTIPTELGDLAQLRYLVLVSNQLTGNIPVELADLSNLESLYLHTNQLDGTIPPELGALSNLTHLYLNRNELSGEIPSEIGDLSNLKNLHLEENQLTGSIPSELGDLSNLVELYLDNNQLSGEIPTGLWGLSNLQYIDLQSNSLSGGIPADVSGLSSVVGLYLGSNQLSGEIPAAFGSLSNLLYLEIQSNQLSGEVPAEFADLPVEDEYLVVQYNAIHSDDPAVTAFLDQKSYPSDWQSTQTVAPENVAVTSVGDHTAWLSWDAVAYQADAGGYTVYSAPTGSGTWTQGGSIQDKSETSFPVTDLDPGTTYDFAVVSYTDPHSYNQNTVLSDLSTEDTVTTASLGCAEPSITSSAGAGVTLSVVGTYDSYLWSTGETTSTIEVDPPSEQTYWVTVTSTGSCEESATILISPSLFADDYETGNTSRWSTTVGGQ
jgi:Leucine-rich repeat (LRR) protein